MFRKDKDSDKASILIICLWTICLLATFCVYLGYNVRQKVSLITRLDARNKLHYIAEAGVKKAIIHLLGEDPEKEYMALNDDWADNPGIFKEIDFGGGFFSVCHNFPAKSSGQVRFGLVDEERKLNINTADAVSLRRIFQLVLGLPENDALGIAYAIIDWRDSDSQLSSSTSGAEAFYYQSLKYPYGPKNGPFELPEELLLVKGVSRDIFDGIGGYITIFGEGRVNINTASGQVLLALGISPKIVNLIIEFRNGKDAIEGSADDNFFSQNSDIATRLQTRYNLSDIERAQIDSLASEHLTTTSSFFSIRSVAYLADGRSTLEVNSVVNRLGKILYWREL